MSRGGGRERGLGERERRREGGMVGWRGREGWLVGEGGSGIIITY